MEINTNIGDSKNSQESHFEYDSFIKFKSENKNIDDFNKLILLINKTYSKLLHNENIKLNRVAKRKYKYEVKRGFENSWIDKQLKQINDLNDLDKYFSSQNLKENYLKSEPINFRSTYLRRIIYYNKFLWANVDVLIKDISQKIFYAKNQKKIEPNSLINSFYQSIELNNSLLNNWKNNKMIFNGSFKLTKDVIKNNKKNLSKILSQNEKLEEKFNNFSLLSKRFFSLINIESDEITREETDHAKSIIFYELNKAKEAGLTKEEFVSENDKVGWLLTESKNFQKVLFEIKEVEKNARDIFSNLENKINDHEIHRVISSMHKIDFVKKQVSNKVAMIQKRGEILSDKIDFLTEKIRRFAINDIIEKNYKKKENELIIPFSVLRHPILNDYVKKISEFIKSENFNMITKYEKKSNAEKVVVLNGLREHVSELSKLIKNLENNSLVIFMPNLNFDKNVNTNKKFEEISKSEKNKNLKINDLFWNELNMVDILLSEILKIQTRLLEKILKEKNPKEEIKDINFASEFYRRNIDAERFLTKSEKFSLNINKIIEKVNLLSENQERFFALESFPESNLNVINMSHKNVENKYFQDFTPKDINILAKKIKLLKIKEKELFKREIDKIDGSMKNEKEDYFFNIDISKLNHIDYGEVFKNKQDREDFVKIFEFFTKNEKSIDNWILESEKVRKDVNKKMAYLITKFNYFVDSVNKFQTSHDRKKVHLLIEDEVKNAKEVVTQKIKNLERKIEKSGKDYDIQEIYGVGPKTKKYLENWKISTIRELIEFAKKSDVTEIIKNLPGIRSETFKIKNERFEDFLKSAFEHTEKDDKVKGS